MKMIFIYLYKPSITYYGKKESALRYFSLLLTVISIRNGDFFFCCYSNKMMRKKNLAAGAIDTDGQIGNMISCTILIRLSRRHATRACGRSFVMCITILCQQHDYTCMRAACSRRRAMRSAVCGCVENRFMSALPLPSSGFTMNICAVAGVASCIGRAWVA